MMSKSEHKFTKYEIARIIGARALQISMDAPLILKMSEKELKSLGYDPIKIAEREFNADVLPITINRPIPRKKKEKLKSIQEEKISDEVLISKEEEIEKEIVKDAETLGLIEGDEIEDYADEVSSNDVSNEEYS